MAQKVKLQRPESGPLYDSNGNQVANVPETKPIYKKWWFWVIAALLLIGLVTALGSDDDKKSSDTSNNSSVEATTAVTSTYSMDQLEVRQDSNGEWVAFAGDTVASDYTGIAKNAQGSWYVENGKVNFNKSGNVTFNDVMYTLQGGKVTAEAEVVNGTTKKVEKTQFRVGETLTFSDKSITFVSANDNFTGYNAYADIPAGMKVLQVTFDFANNSNTDFFINSGEFDCYADNESCEFFIWTDNASFMETLSPGRQASGKSAYFLIPENANSIVVEYEKNIFTSDHVEFIVK